MVGDNAQGYISLITLAVVCTGYLGYLVSDVHDRINIKQRIYALADYRKALKAHAGVDILLRKLGVVAVAVVIELRKNVVPDFDISVAVAADSAVGLTAAVFRAAVIVYLRAGAAGTRAVFPEVILLAEAEYFLCRNADLVMPDAPCLVIVNVDRRIESVRVKSDPLLAREELPAPCYCFMLKIIAEGEVAEHFKISAVTRGMADVFDISGAYTLLAGADTLARRYLLALEPRLHRGHAGVYEQYGFIILRNQREAGQAQMALALKKAQEHFSQFVYTVCFHISSPFLIFVLCVLTQTVGCTETAASFLSSSSHAALPLSYLRRRFPYT